MSKPISAQAGALLANAVDPASLVSGSPMLADMLPLPAYACDATGKVRWFNRKAAELWGRSPVIGEDSEGFCGSYGLYTLDGRLVGRECCPVAEVLRTGVPISGKETSIERPDGTRIVAMVHITPLRDDRGSIIGAINCFHDVTEAKKEDRGLRERERQFRDLLNALPAAIYTTDRDGKITYFNEAAVELAGRRPTLGSDEWCVTWKLYHTDGSPLAHDECPMAIALKEDRSVRGAEAVAERPDGARVPFIPYPTPLHDAAGALTGAVNMLVDISHRKEAETAQRLLFSELNHRTKNNVQTLHALLNAALRETDNAEARTVLAEVIQRVGAIAAAQKALYQGNDAIHFDAADFIHSVCAAAQQIFGREVVIDHAASEGALPNDAAVPLALILNELITNSAKYGANARGEVRVRVRLTSEKSQFTLTVEDEGPGFESVAVARSASGLGLVSGLVTQIGGTLEIEQAQGARCTIRFPAGNGG